MGTKAHSTDIRSRVVDEVAAGSSRRQTAARFRVSVSSAIRWVTLREEKGGVEPRPRGGKSRSPLAAHTARLRADVLDPALAEHGERLFKSMPDGFLAAFSSAV